MTLIKKYAHWRNRKSLRVFLLLGVLFTAVLVSVITGASKFSRESFREPQSANIPNFRALIPKGSLITAPTAMISATPFPAYIISFILSGKSRVGYVAFDTFYGRYRLRSVMTPLGRGGSFRDISQISVIPLGGDTTMALVRGSDGVAYAQTVAVVMQQGNALSLAQAVSQNGFVSSGYFSESETATSEEVISVVDTDNDGTPELVDTKKTFSSRADTIPNIVTAVYRWSGSQFVYDKNLSAGLELDRAVFPAPSALSAPVIK